MLLTCLRFGYSINFVYFVPKPSHSARSRSNLTRLCLVVLVLHSHLKKNSGRRDYSDYSGEHNFSFHSKIVVTIFSFKKIICSYGLGSHSLTRRPTENPPNPLMAFLILIYTNKKHIPFGMCFLLAEDGTRTRDVNLGKVAFYH